MTWGSSQTREKRWMREGGWAGGGGWWWCRWPAVPTLIPGLQSAPARWPAVGAVFWQRSAHPAPSRKGGKKEGWKQSISKWDHLGHLNNCAHIINISSALHCLWGERNNGIGVAVNLRKWERWRGGRGGGTGGHPLWPERSLKSLELHFSLCGGFNFSPLRYYLKILKQRDKRKNVEIPSINAKPRRQ